MPCKKAHVLTEDPKAVLNHYHDNTAACFGNQVFSRIPSRPTGDVSNRITLIGYSSLYNTHGIGTYPPPCIQNTTGILAFGLTSPETKTLLETKNKAAETHITDTEIRND